MDFSNKRNFDVFLEKEEEKDDKIIKKPKASLSDSPAIETYRNHIYFYSSVTKKTSLKLNLELKKAAQNIVDNGNNLLKKDKYIYLHINSFGGSVFSAFSTIDTILNLPVPVVSIIGRPNVGKSTLFNRLTKSRDALVYDKPGVTRDRKYGRCTLNGLDFFAIDTNSTPLYFTKEAVHISLERLPKYFKN